MCDVNVVTGELIRFESDVLLPGYIPVEITRTYKSGASRITVLGYGWRHSLGAHLRRRGDEAVYVDGEGVEVALTTFTGQGTRTDESGAYALGAKHGQLILALPDNLRCVFPTFGTETSVWPLAVYDAFDNRLTYEYGDDGLLRSIIDTLGRRLRFSHDVAGRLIEVALSMSGGVIRLLRRYTYDAHGDLVDVEDAIGRHVRYEYDDHLLVRERNARGSSIYWVYDEARRCVRTWREGGVLYRALDFDDDRRRVKIVDSRGFATIVAHDEAGSILSETDPLGNVVEYAYDERGGLIGSTGPGRGPADLAVYDEATNSVVRPAANGNVYRYFFDAMHRPARILDQDGNEWVTEYGEHGREVLIREPGGVEWQFVYADRGYVQRVVNPLGYWRRQERSSEGRTVVWSDEFGSLLMVGYDELGNVEYVENAVGDRFLYRNDAAGRLLEIRGPDGVSHRCEYDDNDNVTAIHRGTHLEARYEYDAQDRPVREVDGAGRSIAMAYDAEGQLVSVTNGKGERLTIAYDAAGRPVEARSFDGSLETYEYDEASRLAVVRRDAGPIVALDYDGDEPVRKRFASGEVHAVAWSNGRIATGTSDEVDFAREFDAGGRLVRETSRGWSAQVTYDAMSNVVRMDDSRGRRIEMSYDSRRRLRMLHDSAVGEIEFEHDPRNLLTGWRMREGPAARFAYDSSERLREAIFYGPDERVAVGRRYEYDARDLIVREVMWRRGLETTRTTAYEYDAAERLVSVARDGVTTETYAYDTDGNLVGAGELGNGTVGPGDRLLGLGTASLEYDERGRVRVRRTRAGVQRLTYGPENRLRQVDGPGDVTVSFRYDALGRRTGKWGLGGETQFFWYDETLLREEGPTGSIDYLFLPSTFVPLAWCRDGVSFIVVCDAIGSPREVLSRDGEIVWVRETSMWWWPRGEEAASRDCPLGFLGQYVDVETGLHYNRHRYYDPLFARYITPDPIGFRGGLNFYRFLRNPVQYVDPLGLFDLIVTPRCDWNRAQKDAFKKKVDRYNQEIANRGGRVAVRPCARDPKTAAKVWEDCGKKPPKQKSPKGKGKPADCTKDIDHIIDVQMGGPQNPPEVCDNLTPVNSSVNRSMGAQFKDQIAAATAGKSFAFLTAVVIQPPTCPDRTPRTPACA
jgi:RHS repeat-associated protein